MYNFFQRKEPVGDNEDLPQNIIDGLEEITPEMLEVQLLHVQLLNIDLLVKFCIVEFGTVSSDLVVMIKLVFLFKEYITNLTK